MKLIAAGLLTGLLAISISACGSSTSATTEGGGGSPAVTATTGGPTGATGGSGGASVSAGASTSASATSPAQGKIGPIATRTKLLLGRMAVAIEQLTRGGDASSARGRLSSLRAQAAAIFRAANRLPAANPARSTIASVGGAAGAVAARLATITVGSGNRSALGQIRLRLISLIPAVGQLGVQFGPQTQKTVTGDLNALTHDLNSLHAAG